MQKKFLLVFGLCLLPAISYAQSANAPDALRNMSGFSNLLPITNDSEGKTVAKSAPRTYKDDIIPFIKTAIPETAANIITNPEQVFCYQVEKKTKNEQRYTLNGFAVSGFCGELNKGRISTTYSALFTQSPNIITAPAQCKIEPRLMVRFIRGVDYTDILLSSPCPSFTVFYGGKYKAFNIKMGVIDDIIKQLSEKVEPFHSPALLRQTVANAQASSAEESETLEKKQREHAAKIEEEKAEDTAEENKEEDNTKPKSGWGNINLKFKK